MTAMLLLSPDLVRTWGHGRQHLLREQRHRIKRRLLRSTHSAIGLRRVSLCRVVGLRDGHCCTSQLRCVYGAYLRAACDVMRGAKTGARCGPRMQHTLAAMYGLTAASSSATFAASSTSPGGSGLVRNMIGGTTAGPTGFLSGRLPGDFRMPGLSPAPTNASNPPLQARYLLTTRGDLLSTLQCTQQPAYRANLRSEGRCMWTTARTTQGRAHYNYSL